MIYVRICVCVCWFPTHRYIPQVNVLNKAAHAPDTGERMVTCRGWKTLLGKSGGELVYLEPNRHTGEFTLKKMADGCDCFFIPVDFNGDGVMEFVVPEFFGQKLSLVWTEDPLGDYSNEKLVRQRVIDGNLGAAFDVQAVDLGKTLAPFFEVIWCLLIAFCL